MVWLDAVGLFGGVAAATYFVARWSGLSLRREPEIKGSLAAATVAVLVYLPASMLLPDWVALLGVAALAAVALVWLGGFAERRRLARLAAAPRPPEVGTIVVALPVANVSIDHAPREGRDCSCLAAAQFAIIAPKGELRRDRPWSACPITLAVSPMAGVRLAQEAW